jgi:hypothetical protein
MRKKRTLLICAACALLAFLAILAYTSTKAEPSYDGHPLSYWVALLAAPPTYVDQGRSPPGPVRDKATNAVNNIGAAAFPFLIKWIQFEPPVLGYWLSRAHIPVPRKINDLIYRPKADRLASGTVFAFEVLGTKATPAFGELCWLINQTNLTQTRCRALSALTFFGPNALPPMLAVATNVHSTIREIAFDYIAAVPNPGGAAELAAPSLIQCLSETNNPNIQHHAAYALGALRAAPQISVPALLACLNSRDAIVRASSPYALGKFGPQASNAIPALTNALRDSNSNVQSCATYALRQIAPATLTNAPAQ